MVEDYKEAKKLGEAAVRKAVRNGVSPYLPALDALDEITNTLKQVHLGLMELPLSRITGNKEMGRNNAFANNFMPLFDEDSEFGVKWAHLYDSYMDEGIRDAIKVYEYMNRYYVQEGNKRVSVSKYGGSDFILADVTRIMPEKNDSKEVTVYYEYVDFYNVTKNFYIIFTEPGEYKKLAALLGQDLEHEWSKDLCMELKSAYLSFSSKCGEILNLTDDFTMGDAFLIYVSIFPMKSLLTDSSDQIISNIKLAKNELLRSSNAEDISFLSEAPEVEKPSGLFSFFFDSPAYTPAKPLRVGFVYKYDIEESRWVDSHEAGRLYVDEMTEDNVTTSYYVASNPKEGVDDAIERAIADKNELIFTVSPSMAQSTLKAAIQNPNIRFLNCSIGSSSSMRCYYGKFYEASFLMGILAADTLLRTEGSGCNKTIGYLSRNLGNLSMANLNAFAIGASMIDPDCRISMEYRGSTKNFDYRNEWEKKGIKIYADFDLMTVGHIANRPGLYKITDGKDVYIGAPYVNWGQYYTQIVESVLSGAWEASSVTEAKNPVNYWFGLATGVVDIRTSELPYQTRKLLSFFKNTIVNGGFDPFSGEIRTQSGVLQSDASKSGAIPINLPKLSAGQITGMTWMNENID